MERLCEGRNLIVEDLSPSLLERFGKWQADPV